MLYQDRKLGQPGIWQTLRVRMTQRRQRIADLDLLSLSAHLRRDVGVESVLDPIGPDDILRPK